MKIVAPVVDQVVEATAPVVKTVAPVVSGREVTAPVEPSGADRRRVAAPIELAGRPT